jgi:NO-binding membrane sensor protein with MHYT domain
MSERFWDIFCFVAPFVLSVAFALIACWFLVAAIASHRWLYGSVLLVLLTLTIHFLAKGLHNFARRRQADMEVNDGR